MGTVIEDVTVDCDEGGFTLDLVGDFCDAIERYELDEVSCRLTLRLPQDAAIKLAAQVRAVIQPWVDVMEEEFAAYTRATPEERERVLYAVPDEPRPGVFDLRHELGRAPTAEEYRDAADIARKRDKEEGA